MKTKSMTLEDQRNYRFYEKGNEFKILQIKNSTEFVAGDYISKYEVDCRIQAKWDITIKPTKK